MNVGGFNRFPAIGAIGSKPSIAYRERVQVPVGARHLDRLRNRPKQRVSAAWPRECGNRHLSSRRRAVRTHLVTDVRVFQPQRKKMTLFSIGLDDDGYAGQMALNEVTVDYALAHGQDKGL